DAADLPVAFGVRPPRGAGRGARTTRRVRVRRATRGGRGSARRVGTFVAIARRRAAIGLAPPDADGAPARGDPTFPWRGGSSPCWPRQGKIAVASDRGVCRRWGPSLGANVYGGTVMRSGLLLFALVGMLSAYRGTAAADCGVPFCQACNATEDA